MKGKVWYAFLVLVFIFQSDRVLGAKLPEIKLKEDSDPLKAKDSRRQMIWVDSVFQSLSFEDRLGQLFMVAAYSNKDEKHKEEIARLIQEQNIGGLIFFQGGPVRQAHLTNYYQSISSTPLFLAMDAEWGINMRLDSVLTYPRAMTLGAITQEKLIYQMGKEMARQFQELGMHINFGPVVDVNSNPKNPVIGFRAFGEEKKLVTQKAMAYMKGLQENGIIANAKHFPGHGDTEADSHYTLPVIKHSEARIHDIDLYPYRQLINEDLMSVMVAHLYIPSLDSEKNKASTLSKYVVSDLLKKQLKFNGLIFTDALNMKGVTNFYKPGEVDVLALLAGNDILLYSQDVPTAKAMILKAIEEGKITKEEIDERIIKVLKAKYWAGLHQVKPIQIEGLMERINTSFTESLVKNLYADAITVTSNKNNFLPLKNLDLLEMASISIGSDAKTFQSSLDKYGKFKHFELPKGADAKALNQLKEQLSEYNTLVVGFMGLTNNPSKNFGVNTSDVDFIKELSREKSVISVLFGNVYAGKFMSDFSHQVMAFENNGFTQQLVPEVIFGGRDAKGILPVTVTQNISIGSGGYLKGLNRLSYGVPENQQMDSKILKKIDSVMAAGIAKKAMPGGVVLVARNGQVVFEKAYGHYDYSKSRKVTTETVYDLASITKVFATTQAVMFLSSRGLIDMERPISRYLPELKNTNKSDLILKDIMAHEAGLVAFIPHYVRTVESGDWNKNYYRSQLENGYEMPVANEMFGLNSLRDSLWHWTLNSPLRKITPGKRKHDYVYSDLTMYLMQAVVEKLVNQPLDEFLEQNFYSPLGLHSMTFNPTKKINRDNIAPTEEDVSFRKRLIQGYVHDPGAAMYGGVAGHAGLFGKANDLAVMSQLMLNGGHYGDAHLLDKKVIQEFTKRQSTQSRRGWGWDKPEPEKDNGGSAGKLAPKTTFGHTGFTGTCVWTDPENQLTYVFLSNRVHPDANNNILLKEGIRTQIHDIIYQSLLDSKKAN
jgi:beta-N-acetylhexosaminidase